MILFVAILMFASSNDVKGQVLRLKELLVTPYGNTFLVVIPHMAHHAEYIDFSMTTLVNTSFKVYISCPHCPLEVLALQRTRPVVHRLSAKHEPPELSDKKWCYRVEGSRRFSVTLFVNQETEFNRGSLSAFKALPVESWGHYYIFMAIDHRPVVQIISNSDNNSVLVTFRSPDNNFMFVYGEKQYLAGSTMQSYVNKYEVFTISRCTYMERSSMSGTLIKGAQPVGVISGNCLAVSRIKSCPYPKSDQTADMLLPLQALGLSFVLFSLPTTSHSHEVLVVGPYNNTEIVVYTDSNFDLVLLREPLTVKSIATGTGLIITSNKPVQVLYIMTSSCKKARVRGNNVDMGDASICSLVPNEMFYSVYFWTGTGDSDSCIVMYAVTVQGVGQESNLRLNGKPLKPNSFEVSSRFGTGRQTFTTIHIKLNRSTNTLTTDIKERFGCYIYGLDHYMGFMYTAGFQNCSNTSAEDYRMAYDFDNDCDGSIDFFNQQDMTTEKPSVFEQDPAPGKDLPLGPILLTPYGNMFLIALPNLLYGPKRNVCMEITTLVEEEFMVQISCPLCRKFSRFPLDGVSVERSKPALLSVTQAYELPVMQGKGWCFRVEAARRFSVTVVMHWLDGGSAVFRALPVESWGYYYITFAGKHRPLIQIMSNTDENKVLVTFRSPSKDFSFNREGINYTSGSKMKLDIKMGEVFSLSICDSVMESPITGTTITGIYPIGVIIGNCYDLAYPRHCQTSPLASASFDFTADMLFPLQGLGRTFIIFRLHARIFPNVIQVISPLNGTYLKLFSDTDVRKYSIPEALTLLSIETDTEYLLTSNNPVQVVFRMDVQCHEVAATDSSFSSLCPNELFYVAYMWTNIGNRDSKVTMYALAVAHKDVTDYLLLNGNNFNTFPYASSPLFGSGIDSYYSISIQLTSHENVLTTDKHLRFGCYIYGIANRLSLIYPAGFQTSLGSSVVHIYIPLLTKVDSPTQHNELTNEHANCLIKNGTENDFDNNCDGKIDFFKEEIKAVHGHWGPWGLWKCEERGKASYMARKRFCNHPPPSEKGLHCSGSDIQVKNIPCDTFEPISALAASIFAVVAACPIVVMFIMAYVLVREKQSSNLVHLQSRSTYRSDLGNINDKSMAAKTETRVQGS